MRRAEPPAEKRDAEQPIEYAVARVLITSEQRGSYDDALQRLRAIAAARDERAQSVEISGWPAVEVKFAEPLPRRGAKERRRRPNLSLQRCKYSAPSGDRSRRQSGDAGRFCAARRSQGLLQGAEDLALSARFAKQGNPGEVQETLADCKRRKTSGSRYVECVGAWRRWKARHSQPVLLMQQIGAPVAVQSGRGELEIAAHASANRRSDRKQPTACRSRLIAGRALGQDQPVFSVSTILRWLAPSVATSTWA